MTHKNESMFQAFLKFDPKLSMRDAYWGRAHWPKFCQNIFQHVATSKPPLTQFSQNVSHLLLPLHSSSIILQIIIICTIIVFCIIMIICIICSFPPHTS